eukprot:Sspe_Gene.28591::Locus_13075_Transcript_2_2_Confidence_0.667_Length_3090::g.28591::m.28591
MRESLPCLSSRTAARPCCTTCPASMTTSLSASITVPRRCAMVTTVLPPSSDRTTRWIAALLAGSTFDVGSSMTTTRDSRSNARAKLTSCRSPALMALPPTPSSLSRRVSRRPTVCSMLRRLSSSRTPVGSRLKRTVPDISSGSWGMIVIFWRSVCSPIVETSTPSRSTSPLLRSTRRNSSTNSDDFPAPVRPTIPTRSLSLSNRLMPHREGGSPSQYTSSVSTNSIFPVLGHPDARSFSSPGHLHAGSWGMESSSTRRSREVRPALMSMRRRQKTWRKYGNMKQYVRPSPMSETERSTSTMITAAVVETKNAVR